MDVQKTERVLPIFLFLGCLALYIVSAPAGLTWDLGGADGGELATAVYTRGLVHSPGYPTYLLLAQLAHLIPLPSFAHRLNLFSALCMSLTSLSIWYTAALLHTDSKKTPFAYRFYRVAAITLFATSPLVWSQAVIVEVYALAALFTAVSLHQTFLIKTKLVGTDQENGRSWQSHFYMLSFLLALGLGAHFFVGLAAVFAFLYLGQSPKFRQKLTISQLIWAALCFCLGLSVFAYLPLRAGQIPASNWGNPNSWENIWWVVSGQAYAGRFAWSHLITFGGAVWLTLTRSFGTGFFIIACIGLADWWETDRPLLIATLAVITLNLIWVAGYNSADILPYLIPSLMLLSLSVALLTTNEELKKQIDRFRVLSLIGIGFVIAASIYLGWDEIKPQITLDADQYGRHITETLPPQSVVITQSTAETFALRYARVVTTPQTEIVHIDPNLYQWAWYRDDLAVQYPHFSFPADNPNFDDWLQQLHTSNPQFVIYFSAPETTGNEQTHRPHLHLYEITSFNTGE